MIRFRSVIAAVAMCASLNAWAGAEHDHGAPTFQAPKGGILKSTDSAHFELVKNQNIVNIYVYDQKGKPLPTSGFKVTSELELPRKKSAPVVLNDKSTNWEAIIDSKGAHRFTLILTVNDGKEKDYVKFTVEN